MVVALVGTTTEDTASNLQLDVPLPVGAAAGDLAVINYTISAQNDLDLVCLTSGYTEQSDLYRTETADSQGGAYTKLLEASDITAGVVSFQGVGDSAATAHGAILKVYSGVHQTTPIGNTATAVGTNSFVADPPSVAVQAGSVVWVGGSSTSISEAALSEPTNYSDFTAHRAVGATFSAVGYVASRTVAEAGTEDPPAFTLEDVDHGGRSYVVTTIEIRAAEEEGGPTATGTLASGAATADGAATRTAKASGTPAAQAATMSGSATVSGGDAYQPQGVNFDGTNDYLTRGADLTGNADGKKVTGAFWARQSAATDSIFSNADLGFRIFTHVSGAIVVRASNAAGSTILNWLSATPSGGFGPWRHYMFSFDLEDENKRHLYINDTPHVGSVFTYTDDVINLTSTNHYIGSREGSSEFYLGDLADLWLSFGTYIDFSVEENRRKFIGANAASSVDLGADGSTPTGTAPLVFFSGSTATWHTNKGTGGGFTENGGLTDASTNPPDSMAPPGNPTASGSVEAGAATVDGAAAITGRVASGSLQAGSAGISGEALRAAFAAGMVQAQLASIVASASRAAKAQGSPQAQASAVEGAASNLRTLTAEGALQAGDSSAEGVAERTIKASGALASGAASILGAAAIIVQGMATGALQAGAAAIEGAAERTAKASGALASGAASTTGAVTRTIKTVTAAITAGAAAVTGLILRGWHSEPSPGETWRNGQSSSAEDWYDDTPGGGETWR